MENPGSENQPRKIFGQSRKIASPTLRLWTWQQLSFRPCAGGECDDEHSCPRHRRYHRVADRYEALVAVWRRT